LNTLYKSLVLIVTTYFNKLLQENFFIKKIEPGILGYQESPFYQRMLIGNI